ncbi:helix-turn-helix domain-containing protein [Avibacterium avium]|uniref:Transcriptional regulator with XRE-family HTH domain n=2 Tax=Avibacterium TaxID=292486 RepID=A0A379AXD4_AVIGA|nr:MULTISPECIES: helix-turn-helix transcriptional regulator [Avibacterium]POY44671.1 transcriptional regulator [Avibacterium gallinarum]TDP30466.1 transcriptional regulator with XRE-family HTH domain [Avibacterium gallinarum]SUB26966.1 transcriptional repressor DicA [Avibacterium gallinarum]
MSKFIAAEVDMAIGKKIQQRRKELGFTAENLAEQIGVSQQQFSRYERGVTKINVSHLVNIAVILNTPISWFFADVKSENLTFSLQDEYVPIRNDALKMRLDYHWDHLSNDQKRNLINFLDSIHKT